MTKKPSLIDIDLPAGDDPALPDDLETKSMDTPRRGPMATAIGEAGDAVRRRAVIEADIRAENDALAHELVRLRKLGLIVDMIPVARVRSDRMTRDRARTGDLELDDLKTSVRAVGLSNPIRVVADGTGGFDLVQGLRRLSAYRELLAETGDPVWAMIPAGMLPAGETLEVLYRRMVDENLIRKDVSFAEMAKLARAYAEDGVGNCADLDEAVNRLYASASPQKRSYVRRFALLLRTMDKHLDHAPAIPRAMGLQLADRIEADAQAPARLVAALRAAGPRDEAGELAVLRRFLAGQATPLAARVRGAPRGRRRGRITLAVAVGPAGVRATATSGKLELRADIDFSALERDRLEAAIEAFFAALDLP